MHELAELEQFRAQVPAAATGRAGARLAQAIDADTARLRRGPARRRRGLRGPRRLAVLGGAAAIVTAAAVAVPVLAGVTADGHGPAAGRAPAAQPGPAPARTWWTYSVPSQGVATSAAQLVDFATRAAARAPLFPVPEPGEWIYTETSGPAGLGGTNGTTLSRQIVDVRHWQQIGTNEAADSIQHGPLRFSREGTADGRLAGWPGQIRTLYAYLAHLPSSVPALRAVLVANNRKYGPAAGVPPGASGVFGSILAVLGTFALPPRLQAEFYGVLASLPGVRFDTSVRDGAGRPGVGLYLVEYGWLRQEIIVSPRTYQYLGNTSVAVQAHTDRCTGMCWPKVTHYGKGQVLGWQAMLAEAIVQEAGETPGSR